MLHKVRNPVLASTIAAETGSVRTIRAQIIRLRYDHKEVMTEIEKGIHSHFAGLQSATNNALPTRNTNGSIPLPSEATSSAAGTGGLTPFAKVNTVVAGSPASQAGLQAGDSICSFGNINWLNHERLSKVAEVVQQNEGVSHRLPVVGLPSSASQQLYAQLTDIAQRTIIVKISRNNATPGNITQLDLELVPRRDWGGRGLLGCHLLPI